MAILKRISIVNFKSRLIIRYFNLNFEIDLKNLPLIRKRFQRAGRRRYGKKIDITFIYEEKI